MEGRRLLAAAILLPAALAAGCCSAPSGYVRGDRDTPERAFAFVRDAFVQDSVGDQSDSFHPEFMKRQGFTRAEYRLARDLRPGLFAKAGEILAKARLERVEPVLLDGRRGARVFLSVPGGAGVFVLVDDPIWEIFPGKEGEPSVIGHLPDLGGVVRFEGGTAVVELRRPVDFPPEGPLEVRRVEIHHDWLLFGIESLTGFEEFLGEVKSAAREGKAAAPPGKKGEAPQ
jgi:hypothetical protein